MAQRDKYNFQTITQDWGEINYKDVPSYSKTSVGTTGDAYLIRQFLKQFFPFLKTSVVKSSTSVRVKIQEFQINFTWAENGINKEFLLDANKLQKILEPLFEGQGFDRMTDSSYSKPLPKMYNDEGFEVSYGYIYLFVDPDNIENTYEVGLNQYTLTRKNVKSYRSQMANDNSQLRFEMPEETFNYIKRIAGANTITSSQTTNRSDSVMSKKGDEKLPLGPLVQKIIDFLAEKNFGQDVATIKNKFSENGEYTKSDVSSAITYLLSEYILDDNYRTDGSTFYTLSPKGTSYITPKKESAIVGVSSEDTTNFIRNNIYKLADKDFQKSTVAEQALALFVAKNLDVLNDMEKNAPDLLGVLSSGFKILTNYAKGNTAELSPFVPLENQQQLEDQLKEEDFDLSDVDLQEIDLTGLEEDFEINEDELGDVDLTEFDELADFVESELTPVDIDNLDDAQKEIIRVLSSKGNLGYPLKSLKEIYEDLYESIKSNYQLITLRSDLEVLKLMGLVEQSGNTYNLLMTQKVADVVDKLKLPTPIENKKLTSTVEAILRYLYESQTVLSADEIKFELSTNNIILPLKAIFDRLIALMDKGLVYQYSSPTEGIKWKITPLGKEYIDKLPKPKTAGQAVAVRPSPTESATMNPVGTIKTGNDGNDWQVRASSKGVKRWVKIK